MDRRHRYHWISAPHFRRRRTVLNRAENEAYSAALRNVEQNTRNLENQGLPNEHPIYNFLVDLMILLHIIVVVGRMHRNPELLGFMEVLKTAVQQLIGLLAR